MKYLITGAAGFIGYHLAKSILMHPKNLVFGIDNLNSYYDKNLKKNRILNLKKKYNQNKNFFFKKINLCDKKAISSFINKNKFQIIIHLAAQAGVRYSIINPYSYIDNNIVATTNLFEACKNLTPKHMLIASSSSVYGELNRVPFTENSLTDSPIQFYAASKKSSELISYCYSHLYKLPVSVLRFFTVYGPWGRPDMALYKFTESILKKKSIEIFNHGKHKRDFTYIDDLIVFVNKIINIHPKKNFKKPPFKIYNLGSGNPIKLMDYISSIEKHTGVKAKKKFIVKQKGDMLDTHADMTFFFKKNNIKSLTCLDEGISKFVSWYKSYHNLS
jgi:UDP-glucuronate 4-epimerase